MRLAAITPSTAALAAPPPDRFDPAGDGGFATALSDVMRPATDARPSTPKAAERPRDVQPTDRSPVQARPPAASPTDDASPESVVTTPGTKSAKQDTAEVETVAETVEAATTGAEISLAVSDDQAVEVDANPAPKSAAKPKKTGEADVAMPAAVPLMPQVIPHDAPAAEASPDPSGIAPATVPADPTAIMARLTADAAEALDEAPAAADQSSVESPSAPAFAQEMARQTGQTAASRIDAPQPPSAPVAAAPAEQVAVKLAAAANGKGDRIRIQLSPEALGKVDVQLELGDDGHVQAVIRADKPETLHLLMHDAKHLVRGLQDAGFQASASNLQFSLNGDGDGRRQPGFTNQAEQNGTGGSRADIGASAEAPRAYRTLGRAAHGGVDLSI